MECKNAVQIKRMRKKIQQLELALKGSIGKDDLGLLGDQANLADQVNVNTEGLRAMKILLKGETDNREDTGMVGDLKYVKLTIAKVEKLAWAMLITAGGLVIQSVASHISFN